MLLPAILAGLIAGAIGLGGHLSAKETNEKAQELAQYAQDMYDESRTALEEAQKATESALLNLGYAKKSVLEGSITQFLSAYDRVKDVQINESGGIDEIGHFVIDQQEAFQLQEMTSIYKSTFSSGATGAAAGAVVALAASGSLPIVTGVLSTAGTALLAGEVGMAAGLAGSALSFGAAMTPLSAIAAPVVLFTGISSSLKADENLEKAKVMYAEAEVASEKMQTAEMLCTAISKKAEMFNGLLCELDKMFSECTVTLDAVTRKKMGRFKSKAILAENLTEEELKLIAVTRALAGAVKAVIDTPILDENGEISAVSETVYEETQKSLPEFSEAVKEIEGNDYHIKPTKSKKVSNSSGQSHTVATSILSAVRDILALAVAAFLALCVIGMVESIEFLAVTTFICVSLLLMNYKSGFKCFRWIRNTICFILGLEFCILFHKYYAYALGIKHFLVVDIVFGIVMFIVLGVSIPNKEKKQNNFRRLVQKHSCCLLFAAIALLILYILLNWINLSWKTSSIIVHILFCPCAIIGGFLDRNINE